MHSFSMEEIAAEVKFKDLPPEYPLQSSLAYITAQARRNGFVTPSEWDKVAWEKSEPERGKLRAQKILHLIPAEGLHLDLGTGNGDGTYLISKHKKTIGVDYGQKSLQNAARKGVLVYHADARDLPFASDTFSSVSCLDVLEHIQQPELAIGEMARVLKDGGTLVLQTPEREVFKERLLAMVRRLGLVRQKQPYDKPLPLRQIHDLLAGAGFVVLEERPIRYWASNPLIHLISISRLFHCRLQKGRCAAEKEHKGSRQA